MSDLVAVPASAREAIVAYHAMAAPRNATEHKTAAALLALRLDQPHASGVTLADRVDAYWQALGERGIRGR